jgi:transposase-like protein
LFAVGVRQAEVARQLGVSAQAVSSWHRRWQIGGMQALRSRGLPFAGGYGWRASWKAAGNVLA